MLDTDAAEHERRIADTNQVYRRDIPLLGRRMQVSSVGARYPFGGLKT